MINVRFLVCAVIAIATVLPLVCQAESSTELVESLPFGSINWTRGVVSAKCDGPPSAADQDANTPYDSPLFDQAASRLLDTVLNLRINDCTTLDDALAQKKDHFQRIQSMAMTANVAGNRQLADGHVEIILDMALSGGFSQLVLPDTIRQVEPIRPLLSGNDRDSSADGAIDEQRRLPFSGLIVDARGIGLKPSLVPVIVDETGQEVYGPEFVSREYAVQNGVCQYIAWHPEVSDAQRVAPNPLIIKGLRIKPGTCSTIVVSNADGSRLRGASHHLQFLKQCRVVIALDEPKIDQRY